MEEDKTRKKINKKGIKQLKMYTLSLGLLAILKLMNKLYPPQDNSHNPLAMDSFLKKIGNISLNQFNIGPSEVLEILHECESWMDKQN